MRISDWSSDVCSSDLCRIQALQCRQRRAVVAELAVVIVLQYPGVALFGRLQQFDSARQAQGHPHGLLVRRRNECQAEVGGAAQALLDDDSLAVYRNRHQTHPVGVQAVARADGSRVFEPYLVARVEQHAANQIECLLGAADDKNLFGLALEAAIPPEMVGYGLAQREIALGVAIAHDDTDRKSVV